MKVKFLKDPTGMYNLSYEIGEVVNVSDDLANRMIETNHADKTTDPISKDDGLTYQTLTGQDGKPLKVRVPNES